jgi:predicted ATPase
LQSITARSEESLLQDLTHLQAAEFLYETSLVPEPHYTFKHVLTQEVTYQSLLRRTRQQYHARIAQVLETQFPAVALAQPELLAQHYTAAGCSAQAVAYWQQAGRRAVERSAYVEAMAHLTTGLTVLQTLPETPECIKQELAIQATLGVALMALKGYADPDVAQAYTRARALCQHVEDTPQLFPVLWGLWVFYFARGEIQTGHELAEQLLTLAHRINDPGLSLEAHFALGVNLQQLGNVVAARAHMEQALALFDPQQHRAHALLYGQEPQVTCLADLACILWVLGYPDQARQRSHEALTVALTVDHVYSRALVHFFATWSAQLRRHPQDTLTQAAAILTLAQEHAFAYLEAMGRLLQGWAIGMQGQAAEGLALMHQGLAAYQTLVGGVAPPHFLGMLAEVYGQAGQPAEGLAMLTEALASVHRTGDCWWEAELYRLKGELLMSQSVGDHTDAATYFNCALDIARRQQAKSLELRAALSLSRLWQRQGKRGQALELLAPIYGWFTEGFDTPDVQEAKVLMDELRTLEPCCKAIGEYQHGQDVERERK